MKDKITQEEIDEVLAFKSDVIIIVSDSFDKTTKRYNLTAIICQQQAEIAELKKELEKYETP